MAQQDNRKVLIVRTKPKPTQPGPVTTPPPAPQETRVRGGGVSFPYPFDPAHWMTEETKLAGGSVKVSVDGSNEGGLTILFRKNIFDGATGDVDISNLKHNIRVIDAWLVKIGGSGVAGNSLQVRDGNNNNISDQISLNISPPTIARATIMDNVFGEIPAGGTLRFRRVKVGGDAACIVYVLAIRIP